MKYWRAELSPEIGNTEEDIFVSGFEDDEKLMLDLLKAEKVLLVQGTGFNWPTPDHFRVVFLPAENELREAINRLSRFLAKMR